MSAQDCPPKASHFVAGDYVEDTAGEAFVSIHPPSGETIGNIHSAADAIIEQAVESASAPQKEWAATGGTERGRILIKAYEIVPRRNDEIARIETLDTGKALQETRYVDAVSGADDMTIAREEIFGHVL